MRRQVTLIAAVAVAIAIGLGIGLLIPVTDSTIEVTESVVGGPFEMVNHRGETVTQETYAGQHMLIYFGYTFCPDVCPTELQSIALALDEMGSKADSVVPLFVTIDPGRDTVDAMKEYVTLFHPRIVGLTGTPAQVKQMADEYGVYFVKARDTGASTEYLMDHSSLIFLMDGHGRYVTHLRPGMSPEAMARVLSKAL